MTTLGHHHGPIYGLLEKDRQLWTASEDGWLFAFDLDSQNENIQEKPKHVLNLFPFDFRKGLHKRNATTSMVFLGISVLLDHAESLLCGAENGDVFRIVNGQVKTKRNIHRGRVSTMAVVHSQVHL